MNYQEIRITPGKSHSQERSVLLIYTGGTIGMSYNREGQLVPFDFEGALIEIPSLKSMGLDLTVVSFEDPIDSSNVTIEHWNLLAEIIEHYYQDYNGFVVLHGTDTLAYSASALSFMLEHLQKPVIFTGSQLPIGAIRSDASQNLIGAIQIASTGGARPLVQEVCVYFDYFLYRGNRSKKVESWHFDAFKSENYPALAEVGINVEYNYSALATPDNKGTFTVHKMKPVCLGLIKLFPGIEASYFQHALATPGMQALVLETFGSGNAPTNSWFTRSITEAIAEGLVVFNVSQCNGGKVIQGRYVTSRQLMEAGVISGHDITAEAACSKIQFLFSKYRNLEQIKGLLGTPLRGEMSN